MLGAAHSRASRVDSWARTLRTSVQRGCRESGRPSGCADGKSRRISPAVTRTHPSEHPKGGRRRHQRHMKPGMDELAPDGAATLPSSLPGGVLRRVLEHIDANRHRALSLSELSALAHMSTFHFARLFKQSTAVSPHRFSTSNVDEHFFETLRARPRGVDLDAARGEGGDQRRRFLLVDVHEEKAPVAIEKNAAILIDGDRARRLSIATGRAVRRPSVESTTFRTSSARPRPTRLRAPSPGARWRPCGAEGYRSRCADS